MEAFSFTFNEIIQFQDNNMIKKLLPSQQQQKKRKHNNQLELKPQRIPFKNQRQIQSKAFRQYTQQYNNPTYMNDHISQSPIIQSKFGQRYLDPNDEQHQRFVLQIGRYFSQSQNKSQVISINELEQYQPILMSNINYNFKKNFRLLSYTKIKNNIEELRAIQSDFIDYANEQKAFLYSELQKISDFIVKKVKTQNQTLPTAQLMQEIFQKNKIIASLETKLQQREEEGSKLKKQLSNMKISLQKQQEKYKQYQKMNSIKSRQRKNSNSELQNCPNCKILEIKYETLKQELISFEELKAQNENLQEYIFDIEQKIVGIDIQVQRRVSEHIQSMDKSNANKPPPPSQSQSQNYIQILRKLNDQNASLQQKCDRLQKSTMKQHQLLQFEKRLVQKQIDYQRKESHLFQSLTKHEKDKQNLYQKEHYILISEQQISNKIQQLNQRQQQLNQWQSMLNQMQVPNILPSIQRHNEEMQQQNYQIDQADINSFGKIQQQNVNRLQQNKNHFERNLSHNVFIPQLQIHKNESHPFLQRNYYQKLERQNMLNLNSPKSTHQGGKVYTEIIKRQQSKVPNYNMRRKNEVQPYQKMSHRDKSFETLNAKSPKNYRQSSKNSKISTTKGTRNTYLNNYTANEKVGLRQNTIGLTNKLDRLRQQIKRQIKSIV